MLGGTTAGEEQQPQETKFELVPEQQQAVA